MSRENLYQPILSIDLKKSLIRVHRNTLRLLGDPDYIQLLINPNAKMIAIKAGDKRDYLAHKVRKYRFETGYSYELYCKDLLQTMMTVDCGWEYGNIFRLYGQFNSKAGGVSLLDSYQIFKQANNLVRQCGTRDALKIAERIGIKIYYEPAFTNLLGMYTFRWNHRMMFLNPRMESYLLQMVAAHEIGHDARHRNLAKMDGLREFVLFNMKDTTEYEANAFGSHLLLDNDKVYELAKQGYDVVQISSALGSDINLMLIKLQEMNKLGYNFNIPFTPDSKFFRKIER